MSKGRVKTVVNPDAYRQVKPTLSPELKALNESVVGDRVRATIINTTMATEQTPTNIWITDVVPSKKPDGTRKAVLIVTFDRAGRHFKMRYAARGENLPFGTRVEPPLEKRDFDLVMFILEHPRN